MSSTWAAEAARDAAAAWGCKGAEMGTGYVERAIAGQESSTHHLLEKEMADAILAGIIVRSCTIGRLGAQCL